MQKTQDIKMDVKSFFNVLAPLLPDYLHYTLMQITVNTDGEKVLFSIPPEKDIEQKEKEYLPYVYLSIIERFFQNYQKLANNSSKEEIEKIIFQTEHNKDIYWLLNYLYSAGAQICAHSFVKKITSIDTENFAETFVKDEEMPQKLEMARDFVKRVAEELLDAYKKDPGKFSASDNNVSQTIITHIQNVLKKADEYFNFFIEGKAWG